MKKTRWLKRSVWCILTVFFTILFAAFLVGGNFANQYPASLNGMLGIDVYVPQSNPDADTSAFEYYKSDFVAKDENGDPLYETDDSGYRHQVYDDVAMRQNSLDVAEQVASEGSVLLWNKKDANGDPALPLSAGAKVRLFGIASSPGKYGDFSGGSSGALAAFPVKDLKETLETPVEEGGPGFAVNNGLWTAYTLLSSSYGGWRTTAGNASDPRYKEFQVKEADWAAVNSTNMGNMEPSVRAYGDAAIMIIRRNSGEDVDVSFQTSECLDNTYLDLSKEEADVLQHLSALKRIVLLINTRNQMQYRNILRYDIDACFWVGVGGNASFEAIGNVLSGRTNPSGHLVDTAPMDIDSAPAAENFGDFTYSAVDSGVPAGRGTTGQEWNDKYVVYQEGIYVGYRYYETRYEDLVLGRGNAQSAKGVVAGSGSWKYSDEVAFAFGHGESYTTFAYSGYSVRRAGEDYNISVTVTNTGALAGREVVQIYLQKPYTEYDRDPAHPVEKSAVELIGFAKMGLLEAGGRETVTITVKGEDLKSYDSYGAGTYILEAGDYYFACGRDAHDALNNILAKKGKTVADGMDAEGDAALASVVTVEEDDFKKYSVSSVTGEAIVNRFDDVDPNRYEGTANQKITYLSRSDWEGTYPAPVSLACVGEKMVYDMQYGHVPEQREGDEMPLMDTVTSEYGKLTLAMLINLPFEDPLWEDLLNQLTWEEMNWLCTYGYLYLGGATSVSAPGSMANDGPLGIRSENANLKSCMGFPSPTIMACTWDIELVEKLGEAFGLEIMHTAGYSSIYAPGANIHRLAYGGRACEYYSEDGFMSGKMTAAEVRGLQNKGAIVCIKHLILNEQEKNRCGSSTWCNEQALREIYLKPFELGIVEGKANGVMTSLNRIGCKWASIHSGLCNDVLRGEWNFTGYVETDSAFNLNHMIAPEAMAEGIVAGTDVWMLGGSRSTFNAYRNNATVVKAMREACKRNLYTQLHSMAMNGIGTDTVIVQITPWWQTAILAAQVTAGLAAGICLLMTVAAFILHAREHKKERQKNEKGRK